MTKVLAFIYDILGLHDEKVKLFVNKFNHLVVAHKSAWLTLKQAEEEFNRVKRVTTDSFEELKKNTLETTNKAIEDYNLSIKTEMEKIEETYKQAKEKVTEKALVAKDMVKEIIKVANNKLEL